MLKLCRLPTFCSRPRFDFCASNYSSFGRAASKTTRFDTESKYQTEDSDREDASRTFPQNYKVDSTTAVCKKEVHQAPFFSDNHFSNCSSCYCDACNKRNRTFSPPHNCNDKSAHSTVTDRSSSIKEHRFAEHRFCPNYEPNVCKTGWTEACYYVDEDLEVINENTRIENIHNKIYYPHHNRVVRIWYSTNELNCENQRIIEESTRRSGVSNNKFCDVCKETISESSQQTGAQVVSYSNVCEKELIAVVSKFCNQTVAPVSRSCQKCLEESCHNEESNLKSFKETSNVKLWQEKHNSKSYNNENQIKSRVGGVECNPDNVSYTEFYYKSSEIKNDKSQKKPLSKLLRSNSSSHAYSENAVTEKQKSIDCLPEVAEGKSKTNSSIQLKGNSRVRKSLRINRRDRSFSQQNDSEKTLCKYNIATENSEGMKYCYRNVYPRCGKVSRSQCSGTCDNHQYSSIAASPFSTIKTNKSEARKKCRSDCKRIQGTSTLCCDLPEKSEGKFSQPEGNKSLQGSWDVPKEHSSRKCKLCSAHSSNSRWNSKEMGKRSASPSCCSYKKKHSERSLSTILEKSREQEVQICPAMVTTEHLLFSDSSPKVYKPKKECLNNVCPTALETTSSFLNESYIECSDKLLGTSSHKRKPISNSINKKCESDYTCKCKRSKKRSVASQTSVSKYYLHTTFLERWVHKRKNSNKKTQTCYSTLKQHSLKEASETFLQVQFYP